MSNEANFNPYASPAIVNTAPARKTSSGRFVPYESGHTRAVVVLLAGVVWIAFNLGNIASSAMQYRLLEEMDRPDNLVTEADIIANDARQHMVVLGVIAAGLVALISYFMWLHRGFRNLGALGAKSVEQTPGWAVGYYFIPFLSFFKPFFGMSELVRGSDPEGLGFHNGMGIRGRGIVGVWWTAAVIHMLAGRVSGVVEPKNGAPIADFLAATQFDMGLSATSILTVALTCYHVWKVDRWQTERVELLDQMAEDAPPSGPRVGAGATDWSKLKFD